MTGFGSFVRQLWRDLMSQKLRTFMTTFGIVWGTVAVALLLAIGEGVHRQQIRSFAGLGDHIVIGWPSRTSIPFEGLGRGRRILLDEDDIDYLRSHVDDLAAISSEYQRSLQLRLGDRGRRVDVSGVSPIFGIMRSLVPAEGGRFLNPTDMAERRRVAFLGDHLARDLFGDEAPVGQEIMLHGSPFTVIGVMVPKAQDSAYSGRDHSKIFIPSSTFRALTGQQSVDVFIFRATSAALNPQVAGGIVEALARRERFDPMDDEAVMIWDTSEMFAFFDAFMLGFKIFMGLMGGLTLVVGGIGVSNIMNVVVEERTREIGIKMALGARPRAIMLQFLTETLLITAVGGAVGIVISAAICAVIPSAGAEDFLGTPVLSPSLALLTAAILGSVGLISGYFPARDASRLDPVVAMKL
jgi:putative ABC transport system permease protein